MRIRANMQGITQLVIAITLFSSCAKIPAASLSLIDAIDQEGDRVHRLNVSLINSLFNNKSVQLNAFIEKDYTPRLVDNFRKLAPADTDFKQDFTDIIQALLPQINARRDSLQTVLNDARTSLLNKLQQDHDNYKRSVYELKHLLQSAVNLNEKNRMLFNQTAKLTNVQMDLQQIERSIDKFIHSGGNISEGAMEITEAINFYLNK